MKKEILILIIILILTFFLRIVNIIDNPKGMYGDELTLAFDSYSIYKTGGYDQKGEYWPVVFSLGGARPPGYVYASIPFIALFGPTALGARLLSVLSGVGIVLLVYLICKLLLSQRVGLLAAAFLSINPWDLSLSRASFETHFALFLSLLGIYGLLKARTDTKWYLLSALGFGLSIQTYPTYRLEVPLLVGFLLLVTKQSLFFLRNYRNIFVLVFATVIIFLSVLGFKETFGWGNKDRFSNINLFADQQTKNEISQKVHFEQRIDSLPTFLSGTFHNKYIEYFKVASSNYFDNFTLHFLFKQGDANPRHNPALMGGFYYVEIVLMALGVTWLFKKSKSNLLLLLGWLLTAPVAGSLVDKAHFLRNCLMLPPLIIFSASGLSYLLTFKRNFQNRLLIISLVIVFILQEIFFIDQLYFLSSNQFARFWAYPAKEASLEALKNKKKYDFVILSEKIDSIQFAYPVYATLNPFEVIAQNKSKYRIGKYDFKKFGNVYIGSVTQEDAKEFIKKLPGSVYYIGEGGEKPYLENTTEVIGPEGLTDLSIARKYQRGVIN